MTEFYTSDEHYGHDEIIIHCGRPYKNTQRMVRDIIKKHNSVVGENDTTWHLGDFAMAGPDRAVYVEMLLKRLNGTHILILGNHDRIDAMKYVDIGFQSVHTSHVINRENHTIVMAHDPSIWNVVANSGSIVLCGHIHNLFKSIPEKKIINIGVDVWDFYPITLEQILDELRIQ